MPPIRLAIAAVQRVGPTFSIMHVPADIFRRFAETDDIKIARGLAHIAFDSLWKSKRMTRTEAYAWLARNMGLSSEDAHIALFDLAQCQQVRELVKSHEHSLD